MNAQTCVTCAQTYPLTEEFFSPSKKWASGWNSSCRDCDREKRRERRRAREEDMSEAEWHAARDARVKAQKEYRERNKDKLRDSKQAYKRKAQIPKYLRELQSLLRLQSLRDDPDGYRRAVDTNNAYVLARHGDDRLAASRDPAYISLYILQAELGKLTAYHGRSYLDRRIAELQAEVESYTEREIKAALDLSDGRNREYADRDLILTPAERRWLERLCEEIRQNQFALSPEQLALREEALWADYRALVHEGLENDLWMGLHQQEVADGHAERKGRAPKEVDLPVPLWGGLQAELDRKLAEDGGEQPAADEGDEDDGDEEGDE